MNIQPNLQPLSRTRPKIIKSRRDSSVKNTTSKIAPSTHNRLGKIATLLLASTSVASADRRAGSGKYESHVYRRIEISALVSGKKINN